MNEQEPSVGRIVHYVLPIGRNAGAHRPAIITQVWQPIEHESAPGMSNLTVFCGQSNDFSDDLLSTAPRSVGSVHHSAEPRPGTWHWPERV